MTRLPKGSSVAVEPDDAYIRNGKPWLKAGRSLEVTIHGVTHTCTAHEAMRVDKVLEQVLESAAVRH